MPPLVRGRRRDGESAGSGSLALGLDRLDQLVSAGQSEPGRPWQVELPIPPGQRDPTDSLVVQGRDASGKIEDYRVSISMLPNSGSTDNR